MRLLLFAALALPTLVLGQVLSGAVEPAASWAGRWMVLHRAHGSEHIAIDSVSIGSKGEFRFRSVARPTGYYRLGVGEDQVDVILTPNEPVVTLQFGDHPLREHLLVRSSVENQRLWEYKYASREAQTKLKRIGAQRAVTDPRDADALSRLALEEKAVNDGLQTVLDRLVRQDTASYFSKVVLVDKRLMAALPVGPVALRDAMAWGDASLTRSSVYERAIMAMLQATTPAAPSTLANASDSILAWASGDTVCWAFAREQLIELFSAYGPEEVVQHLVDHYVSGPRALVPPDGHLLGLVAAQLRTSIGSMAPDVELSSPGEQGVARLHGRLGLAAYTVLFFYSSTCDHCHEQMPRLNAIHQRFGGKGLQVLGIALDAEESEFRANIAERQLGFPCYTDLMGWGSPAATAFAVRATPWLVLIDRQGRIAAKPHDAAELDEMLSVLLP